MKKFIIMVLCVSTFFIGLGGLVDKAAAKFKSDERALEIIRQARVAIGGDANINNVRSMSITAKSTKTFDADGVSKTEQGDLEINLQLPNKFSKMLKFGNAGGEDIIKKDVKVIVMKNGDDKTMPAPDKNGDVLIFKKEGDKNVIEENNSADGKKVLVDKIIRNAGGEKRHNELFRTTFALLLTAPEGLDVSYTYVGEGSVDGSSCDIISAQTGGESFKLYIDKSTHLPRMMSFQSMKPFMIKIKKDEMNADSDKEPKVFVRNGDAPRGETAEFQIKFSDYRSAGNIRLPYRWTQTIGDKTDETVDVVSYEINPANIAEKFSKSDQKIMIRTEKP